MVEILEPSLGIAAAVGFDGRKHGMRHWDGPTEPPLSAASESPTTEPTATLMAVPLTETPVQPTATSAATPHGSGGATVAAAAHTPIPVGGPSAPLPTQVPLLQSVEIPQDHALAAFAMLPADSLIYAYINIETTSIRPDLREHVEFQLGHFVSQDELPFAEELLSTAGARALTLSIPFEGYEWACVMQGDLSMIASALSAGGGPDNGLSASLSKLIRG